LLKTQRLLWTTSTEEQAWQRHTVCGVGERRGAR
jgi:hypothetical protein